MGLNSCENYESQKISLDLSKWLQTDNPAQPNLTSMGWVEKEPKPNPTQPNNLRTPLSKTLSLSNCVLLIDVLK